MAETDIERQNWPDFFQDFCRRHETWRADVDAFRFPAGQPEEIARNLHLRSIEVGPGEEVRVVLRRPGTQDVMHTVARPSRVTHVTPGEGRPEELQVQGANTATVIRFHQGGRVP